MNENKLFSISILDFVKDRGEFEEIDHLFDEEIPDEVFAVTYCG